MDAYKLYDEYKEYKNKINQTMQEIINMNNIEEETEINDFILLPKESDLFSNFLLFTNYQKLLFLNFDLDFDNHNLLFKEFSKMKIYKNNLYNDLFKTIFYMQLFCLIKIEKTIASIYKNADYELITKYDNKDINNSYIIIIHILNILYKLYQKKIYNLNKILLFFDAIIIFINKQTIISDRYIKLKNIIFFDLLFDKFFLQFLKLILNNPDQNRDDVSSILNYLIKILRNKQIKSHFNYSILIKRNILEKIMNVLFNDSNFSRYFEIYSKYKNTLIDCFSEIYINNTNNSNFFETLIKQNKNAFMNIMNFETKKDFISNDIYAQNFYLELLNKIYSKEKILKKEKKQIFDTENFFVFNGVNSKMNFFLNSFSLYDSMIIFSFKLSQDIDSLKNSDLPLIIFEADDTKDIIFEILIRKDNNINKLFIFQTKKNKSKKKEIHLDKIQKILEEFTYYLVIRFEDKKIKIYFLDENQEKIYENREIFEINKKQTNIRMKIGNDDGFENNNAFKGYIGPLLILQNLKIDNNLDKKNIINNILELKNLYYLLPFLLSKESIYNFINLLIFSSAQEKINFANNKKKLQNSIKSFECSLYLTPEIINIYYSLFLKNETELTLPRVPNTIIIPENYTILKMNISTMIRGNIFTEFLRNNGLDYFILIYEYFYQYFNIILENQNELNFLLNNEIIDNVIKDSINTTLIILNNYSYYRFIVTFQKKFKTLFRNLYDMLIYSNKISNKIFSGISENFYDLCFIYKRELNLLQNYINILSYPKELLNDQTILLNFSNGLIDMIYSIDLYEKYQGEIYLNTLLKKTINLINDYIKDKNTSKIFPFKLDIFLKIVSLSQILEKSFTSDYKNKNELINSFFELLKIFLKSMKSENQRILFRKLFMYIINKNENNLVVTLNFLNFILEMTRNNYSLDNDNIEQLLNYYSKINNSKNEKEDKKIIEDINESISQILVIFSIFNNSNERKTNFWDILEKINNNEIILSKIIKILSNIFDEKIISCDNEDDDIKLVEKENKDNILNYMNIFENSFDCIINLFNISISKIKKVETQDEQNLKNINDIIENNNFSKLLELLTNIQKKLESELSKNKNNKYCIYYLINYLKFYHYIAIEQSQILQYLEKNQIDNIINVIDLINKYNLINICQKFEVMYNFNDGKKTIIEMIFELAMNLFLNDKNDNDNYRCLLQNYNFIFFNKEFQDKSSIFFINDILRYYKIKKSQKLEKYRNKLLNTFYFNDLFKDKDSFDDNFTTYFLEYILKYQNKFSQKKYNNAPISQLNSFLDELNSKILEEHKILYNLDKNFFFKKKNSKISNDLIQYIIKNHLKKEGSINDLKNYYESYLEKSKNEINAKEAKIQLQSSVKTRKESKGADIIKDKLINKKSSDNILTNDSFNNENKINYFFDYDEFYVTNFKKEIMNCIFSTYYLDEFFYDESFCLIKKFYLNNFITNNKYLESKQLNFPSRIKHFRNNFEPPLFIKKFKNYVVDPYLPITHSYIENINLSNISLKKSINLKKKEFYKQKNTKEIECEIIRNEVGYFGKIIYDDKKKYLLFKEEEEKRFFKEDGIKYALLFSWFNENYNSLMKRPKIKVINTHDKNILILTEEIEEIVEMRVFLLWKACEIYLKNGKSYLFNFLTTDEYNNFMKNVVSVNKIKISVRKNDKKSPIKLNEKNIITKSWKKGIISNYEYLLFLNRYGSRSFQDPTQYPVFPWVLNDYKNLETFQKKEKIFLKILNAIEKIQESIEDEKINSFSHVQIDKFILDELNDKLKNKYQDKIKFNKGECKEIISYIKHKIKNLFRDFKYFPAHQTKEKRYMVIQKYEEDSTSVSFPFHCGSHYSTSGYIYYYLMRQQPYDNSLVKMQGYNLENTNRCFININYILKVIQTGMDNRELIPEFYSKIEHFFNLNCDSYGVGLINDNFYMDDCVMDLFPELKTYLSRFTNFIIQHRNLLNSKIIGLLLKKWIDIIFGINQLPKEGEERKESCIVLSKYSYEEKLNIEKKINEKWKINLNENQIKEKISNKANPLINFGITPVKIFNMKHPKLNQKEDEINNEINDDKKDDEYEDNEGLECLVNDYVTKQNQKYRLINIIPLFFKINPSINKIFIYDKNQNILICDCQLYNQIYYKFFGILKFQLIDNSYISCYGQNSLYQIKYSFSSFENEKINLFDDKDEEFHTYYFNRINYFINKDKIESEIEKQKEEIIKILTCRHYDFSFKIYYYIKKNSKKEIISKVFSYICEDFVSSCTCISSNSFAIGLNNGKLIIFKIISSKYNYNAKNVIQSVENIQIKKEKYIQAHQGKINMIEIDKRLGVIITAGDDNYIFIRKLYDLELLMPIKIKKKYIILMIKISSFNFIYILCLNQLNNKKKIFGYTLSGIRFAKSDYGSYDNINFREDGNLITLEEKKNITILSGSDLTKININENNYNKEANDEIKKIIRWVEYDCFFRKGDEKLNKIMSFFSEDKDKGIYYKTLNLSEMMAQ